VARIDLITGGIYRISTTFPGEPIVFNQFVIDDECPALIHTGMHPIYDEVRKAVSQIIDPKRLEFVVVPHFEADECGGMGRFVKDTPEGELVCSEAGHLINLSAWDYSGRVKPVRDGDVLELGRHRLRFLETPHVHHWDSMMVVEETTQSLFPADLFIQPEDQPAVVTENLGREMCQMYREVGIFAAREPVRSVVDRLEQMPLQWVHPMHGGSMTRHTLQHYIDALRTNPFEYAGRIFGRDLPR
jgi:flavorubredoxin